MSEPKQESNTVIALIAIAGFSAAAQTGLVSELFSVLGEGIIPSAQAQILVDKRPTTTENFRLEKFDASRISVEKGIVLFQTESGELRPAADGFYQLPDGEKLTVKNGVAVDKKFSCSGTQADCPSPWVWDRDASNDSPKNQILQNGRVIDTWNKVQPTNIRNFTPTRQIPGSISQ